MVTRHTHHWHLTMKCPVTVATVRTIVITDHLQFQIKLNQISGPRKIKEWYKTTQIAYCGSFWMQFVCHMTYLPISPQERVEVGVWGGGGVRAEGVGVVVCVCVCGGGGGGSPITKKRLNI